MNNEKFSVELELVTSKFTNRMDNLKNKITSFADKVKDKSKIALNIDPKIDAQLDMYKNKLINLIKDFDSNIDIDIDKDGNLNVAEKDVEKLRNAFSKMAPEAKGEINQLLNIIKKLTNSVDGKETSKIKQFFNAFKSGSRQSSDNLKNSLSKSFDSGISRIKKFTLSLFGIRSIYSLLSRASSAYMSQDTANANKIQAAWIGLGSIFAPLIEKIANFAIKGVSYVNVFIKALTGVDLLARAATKSIDKMSKAGKSASRNLSGLDEITNIGGSSSGLAGGIASDWTKAFDNVKLNPTVVNFIENLADKLKFVWEKLEPSLKTIWNDYLKPMGKWLIEKPERLLAIFGSIIGLKLASKIANIIGVAGTGATGAGATGLLGLLSVLGLLVADVWLINVVVNSDDWKETKKQAKGLKDDVNTLNEIVHSNADAWKETRDELYKNAKESENTKEKLEKLADQLFKNIKDNEDMADSVQKSRSKLELFDGTGGKNVDTIRTLNKVVEEDIELLKKMAHNHELSDDQLKKLQDRYTDQINSLIAERDEVRKNSWDYEVYTKKIDALEKELNYISGGNYDIDVETKTDTIPLDNLKKAVEGAVKGVYKMNITADTSKAKTSLKTFFSKIGDTALTAIGLKGITQKIASLDVGTNYVPNDQMALIHKGEAVIPKKFNSTEYFSQNNEKVESLLEELIDRVDRIDFNPYIGVEDIGRASVKYINTENRKQGRSVI